jgi:hypothetical protein
MRNREHPRKDAYRERHLSEDSVSCLRRLSSTPFCLSGGDIAVDFQVRPRAALAGLQRVAEVGTELMPHRLLDHGVRTVATSSARS